MSLLVVDGQRLGADCRLHKTEDFSSVFAFRRVLRGRFYSLHWRPNGLQTARLGVVAGKRFARRAVLRNLVKRLAREAFRRCRTDLPACDLVMRLHAAPAGTNRAARILLHADLEALLARLQANRAAFSDSSG